MTTEEVRRAGNEAQRQRGLERAREVLRLHDSGLRGPELAAALGVAPGSVRSLLTRSRRRLGRPTPSRVRLIDCPRCDGTGMTECGTWWCTDDHGGTCPVCEGVGEVPASG